MLWVRKECFLQVFFAVSASFKLILCQYHVCLHKDTSSDAIQLKCTVDQLAFPVRFLQPNGSLYATCDAPDDKTEGILTCGVKYLTQDRGTHTTTLTIYKNVSFPIFGLWTCTHGSANATIAIEPINKEEKFQNDCTGLIVFSAISGTIIVVIVIFVLIWLRCIPLQAKRPKVRKNKKEEDKQEELEPLIRKEKKLSDGFSEPCHTCQSPAICAICASCEHVYCEICVAAHIKYYPGHNICQVQHVYTTDSNIKCKQCNTETATDVCTECIKVFCESCVDHHLHPNAKRRKLNSQSTLQLITKPSENKTAEITLKYKMTVWMGSKTVEYPIRICGIAILYDGRIAVADSFNSKLQIFNNAKLQFQEVLMDEPRGLAAMLENKIALTFPYSKEITIFNIEDTRIVAENHIKMKDLRLERLRPFAIAYDDGWFAVEVGEGEDGQIVILDGKTVINKISNKCNFAYYTGNTIRMALERRKKRLFVSAMSRKTVSCVSFDGNVLWTFAVPSPRSLVFIPSLIEKNLILASRRCGAIYQLNADDASDDILVAKGDIKSPRYMAYNEKEQLLCIQVATNDGGDDLLVYKYHPSVIST